MPKLKPTCREKRKTAGVRGVSPVGRKVEELWRKGFVKNMSFEPGLYKREGVIDGDLPLGL